MNAKKLLAEKQKPHTHTYTHTKNERELKEESITKDK